MIEGASDGAGLGTRFLKHVERCNVLIHLIDGTVEDVVVPYKTIRKELKKYSPALASKPEVIGLNKIDALSEEEVTQKMAALKKASKKGIFAVSGISKQGLTEMLRAAYQYIKKENIDGF